MGQSWERLLFAHWPFAPRQLERLVPSGLHLDTRDGCAWLGVTPFRVVGLHPRLIPPLPAVSTFLETNVRTYVVRDEKPGILFFKLLATSRLAVEAARVAYWLPYRLAEGNMISETHTTNYAIELRDPGATPAGLQMRYTAADRFAPAPAGSLEHWLVERYCLYTQMPGGQLLRTDIHHPPWSIAPANASINVTNLEPAALRPLNAAPLVHLADRQDVLVWSPTAA